eukprot:CAMPEP_0197641592 /NCGR_PEP_ID=MMETSP1338-20131121/15518_1 /TAXON_ID=43686 ORGANISM="Pelagodinium beii, Strain RCC1491" /NCGR_SAMPLE_ID=MMETSP1338 /ASSEMBLY_ACC=CAM_ASM_000754 /LENGTH=206 /DNA_ID=CAMNT_0043214607 /DNA_START=679 /DNA_END=1296 /DNA_ORIENTATION=-
MALQRAGENDIGDGVQVSNIGGYQSPPDLFSGKYPSAGALHESMRRCVVRAALTDGTKTKASPIIDTGAMLSQVPECWLNVSQSSALNQLHDHADAPLTSIFYAQVPEACGGNLLFRLSPGKREMTQQLFFGKSLSEPGECHASWMWHPSKNSVSSVAEDPGTTGVVHYADILPEPGTLIVFPGWIPHCVAPHFGHTARVSVAGNW